MATNLEQKTSSWWTVERRVTGAYATAIGLLLVMAMWSGWSIAGLLETASFGYRMHQTIATLERSAAALEKAVTSVMEFTITGDDTSVAAAEAAIREVRDTIAQLPELLAGSDQQLERLALLEQRTEQRIAWLNETIAARRTNGEAAQRLVVTRERRELTAAIRDLLDEMEETERMRLIERQAQDEATERRLGLARVALLAAVIAIILLGLMYLRRELRDRKRLAEDLQRSRLFLESIIEHLPTMMFIKDARDLRFVAFNRAGESLLGIGRQELLGKSDLDLFPAEQAEAFQAADRRVLESFQPVEFPQEPIRTRTGEERLLHTRKIAIAGPDGVAAYLLGISEDITEQVAANQRIRELNESLRRSAAALESANKELEGFSYSVSHDLRAPLRAIAGFAQMLEEDYAARLDDEGRRYIQVIRDGARRMGHLIEDLLAFSRLSRKSLEITEVDTNDLVARAIEEAGREIIGEAPAIEVGELPPGRGDPALLYQVWMNLISNALKYTAKSAAPRIEIGGSVSGGEMIYHVSDNGVGFDMRYVDKLFGVFQRLHRADEYPGTGVGLAIVHRIVSRHGGRVWAEGEVGKGAKFHFTLPRPLRGSSAT